MSNATLILETHLHSQSSAWTRSFHLRLPHAAATKSDILTLVRASLARLGLASPVVDAQITLYFTLNGRVLSLPGTSTVTTSSISIPVYDYNPPQIISYSIPQQPAWPLALTYANGINHLHTYGPAYQQHPQQTTTLINPGGTLTFLNLNLALALPSSSAIGANRPVVSDVVRETRLDAVAEDALAGLLDWALGPNGLKLVLLVDVDGRDVLPAVVALPEPAPLSSPVPATPPPASSPPPPAASDAEAATAE
ncbi:hypothetical protein CkaCkLH20_03978 [Colletotrichum karsti]|uniref:Uncharacterized protein n=1 Tax=Colletotrichum karsti TaxID=1095194 RepID=A0A9P6IB13_9PEZI|nr:uncharacterized protein CkaCkLH20_03978 [Colletotrichum karsti]KAF9878486.1 hypothetical protein CkaCkLH20_03978 [Colletotrichum karsti]